MTRIFPALIIIILTNCNTAVTQNNGAVTFMLKDVELVVDPNDGAKDISLNASGIELLTSKDVRKEYYGSSLWLSPQKDYWPQPGLLDYGQYEVSEIKDGIRFTSKPDDEHGYQYFKEIIVDNEKNAFIHRYRIKNITDSVSSCAAWEVSRLHKKGLSFFPVSKHGIDMERNIDSSITTLTKNGMMWHSYDPSQVGHPGKHCKTFAFGAEGWMAYAVDGVLLIKQFPNVAPEYIANGESDIEIYVCPRFNYIELESQGPYTEIAPGEDLEYVVTWYLKKIPGNLDQQPGNPDLVKLIRETIE
jgi:hypothetical protein